MQAVIVKMVKMMNCHICVIGKSAWECVLHDDAREDQWGVRSIDKVPHTEKQGRNHGWKVEGDQGLGPNTGALALRARPLFPISYTRFCTRSQATNHSAGRYGDGAVKIPRRGDVNLRAAASDVARPRYAACMRPSVRGAARLL